MIFCLTDFLSYKSRFNSSKNERISLLKIKPEICMFDSVRSVMELLWWWVPKRKIFATFLRKKEELTYTVKIPERILQYFSIRLLYTPR